MSNDESAMSVAEEFGQLIEVVTDAQSLIEEMLRLSARIFGSDDVAVAAVAVTIDAVGPAVSAVVADILSGVHVVALREHHLATTDGAWTFKYLGYTTARDALRELPTARTPERRLRVGRRALKWLNVVLGSLADVLPAGGVLKELKEGTEAAVDTALNDPG